MRSELGLSNIAWLVIRRLSNLSYCLSNNSEAGTFLQVLLACCFPPSELLFSYINFVRFSQEKYYPVPDDIDTDIRDWVRGTGGPYVSGVTLPE